LHRRYALGWRGLASNIISGDKHAAEFAPHP
jgi:hypothetical protein